MRWGQILAWEQELRPECEGLEGALQPLVGVGPGGGAAVTADVATKVGLLLQRCGAVVLPRGLLPEAWVGAVRRAAMELAQRDGADAEEAWPSALNTGGRVDICPPWRPPFDEEFVSACHGALGACLPEFALDFLSILAAFPVGGSVPGHVGQVPEGGQQWHMDTQCPGVVKVQCALTAVDPSDGMIQIRPWGVGGRLLALDSLRPGDCLAYQACVRHRGTAAEPGSRGKLVLDMNFRLPQLGIDNVSDGTVALWSASGREANQRRRNRWEELRSAAA